MQFIKNHYWPIILFIFALILRLLYRSFYLEDWDSVQFALSLHHYSLIQELPHPPGYPLYILVGKFLNLFLQNDTLSLIYFSIFTGALSVLLSYLLAKKMFNQKIAVTSALIFTLLPVHWSLSEQALTNIPGLFVLTLLITFLYIYQSSYKITLIIAYLFRSVRLSLVGR